MPPPANAALARLDRRKSVAELYLRGETQWEIAQKLGIGQGTVSKDLAAIRAEWIAAAVRDFERDRVRELGRIDRIEEVAWAAWERSCLPAETLHVKTETEGAKDKDGKAIPTKTVSEKTTKGQYGDPRFLERVGWCVEQRCRILGLVVDRKRVDGTLILQLVEEIVDADHPPHGPAPSKTA